MRMFSKSEIYYLILEGKSDDGIKIIICKIGQL